jgi:hypothetical protein
MTGPTNIGCAWTQTWTTDYTITCTKYPYTSECLTYTWTVDTEIPVITVATVWIQQENVIQRGSTNLASVSDNCLDQDMAVTAQTDRSN